MRISDLLLTAVADHRFRAESGDLFRAFTFLILIQPGKTAKHLSAK